MNRAQRMPKPAHLPDTVHRDVLTRIHFYHIKEWLLLAAKTAHNLPHPYAGVLLYQDLSVATSQHRKEFATITATLRDHNIIHRWGFPTKLLVYYQSQQILINTPKDGYKKLQNWGLSLPLLSNPPRSYANQKS